jgi:hypothetical protein
MKWNEDEVELFDTVMCEPHKIPPSFFLHSGDSDTGWNNVVVNSLIASIC